MAHVFSVPIPDARQSLSSHEAYRYTGDPPFWPRRKHLTLHYTSDSAQHAGITQKLFPPYCVHQEQLLRKVRKEVLPLGSTSHNPHCQ